MKSQLNLPTGIRKHYLRPRGAFAQAGKKSSTGGMQKKNYGKDLNES